MTPTGARRRWRPGLAFWFCASVAAGLPAGCRTNGFGTGKNEPAFFGNIPAHWTAARITAPEESATGWLDDLNAPRLKEWVETAVANNYDLAATASRVRQAMARARIAGADRLPQFDASLDIGRSQNLRGATFQTVRANTFSLGFDLDWEVDLWGRIANLRGAALEELDAADAEYQAARLSLAANVTKTALELIESEMQAELSRQNLESLQTNLEILDNKLEAGDADDRTALEISLSRADVARARSTIAQQQSQADAARRLLETVLGDYPAGRIAGLKELPALRRQVPAGLPSELLLRRPDLIAAESRVDAKCEELAAARKALLPSIRITGSVGTSTTQELKDLFDVRNLVWSIADNLAQPIFLGGRLRAAAVLTEAERDEVAARYAETALTAFREVETALAAEVYYVAQQAALTEATEEAGRAEQLSLSQYEKGLVDIITLLESQRRAFDARSALLSVRRQRLENRIDLYLALGGDFDSRPEMREAPPVPVRKKPPPHRKSQRHW